MKKIFIILAAVIMATALAQVTPVTKEVFVDVSLEPIVKLDISSSSINKGPVRVGSIDVDWTQLNYSVGNVPTVINMSSADAANGWVLGSQPGINTFAVEVQTEAGSVFLTKTNQNILTARPYGSGTLRFKYHAPTEDTLGARIPQGFPLKITASE